MVKTQRQECERPVLKLRFGQRMYSKWKDCKTYPGKVKTVNHDDDTLMIEFDDGIIHKVNAALFSRKLPEAVRSVKQKDDVEKTDDPKPYDITDASGHIKNSNNQGKDMVANKTTKTANIKEHLDTDLETNGICTTIAQNEAMNTDTENDDQIGATRTDTEFKQLEENTTMLNIARNDTENANGKEHNYVVSTEEITEPSSNNEDLDLYYSSESEYKPSKESKVSDESDLELNESYLDGSETDKFNNNETESEIADVAMPQTHSNSHKQSTAMEMLSDSQANKTRAKVLSCKTFSSIHVLTTSNNNNNNDFI